MKVPISLTSRLQLGHLTGRETHQHIVTHSSTTIAMTGPSTCINLRFFLGFWTVLRESRNNPQELEYLVGK
jgi:hypothetical protein